MFCEKKKRGGGLVCPFKLFFFRILNFNFWALIHYLNLFRFRWKCLKIYGYMQLTLCFNKNETSESK